MKTPTIADSIFLHSVSKYSHHFVDKDKKFAKELNLRGLLEQGKSYESELRVTGRVGQISLPERIVRGVLDVENDIENAKPSVIAGMNKFIGVLLSKIPKEDRERLIARLEKDAQPIMDKCSLTYENMASNLLAAIRGQESFLITKSGSIKYNFVEEIQT